MSEPRPIPRPGATATRPLTPEEFSARFEEASRRLWVLAAGVLGSRDQVEDVLQESALIALSKLAQFEPGTSFTAWISRVVRFVALNALRARGRRASRSRDPQMLEREHDPALDAPSLSLSPDPHGSLDADDAGFDDELAQALGGLKPVARACLLLKTVNELEYTEIAELLGIPEGTAMSHVHRARGALRERLAQVVPSGGRR